MNANVVFLPGTLTDDRIWTHQKALFPSSVIVDLRHQDSLQKMLDEITKVNFEKFHIIGFSMGGYVGQEFGIRFPERVQSLTMIGSSAMGYPAEEKEIVLKTMPLIKPGVFKGITEKRLKEYLHPEGYADEELKHLIKDMSGEDAAVVYLNQLKATLDRRQLTLELSLMNFPIRFIAGRDDLIVKLSSIKESQSLIPGSELHIIEECGHFIPLERPGDLNQILLKIQN